MISNGFVPVPRSVLTDSRYKSARLKYQKVLWVIFEMAAFKPTKHVVGKNLIDIEIGQFCVTIRKLAEICNKEVKYEEDLIDRNLIDRAITYWETCQYVRQTFIHKKTLLTITIPEFYENSNKSSLEKTGETTSETTSETKKTSVNNNKSNSYEKKESITETTSETTSETSARHKRTKRTKKEIRKDNVGGTDVPKKKTLLSSCEEKEGIEKKYRRLMPEQQLSLQMLKEAEINTSEETLSFWARTYETDRLRAVVEHCKRQQPQNLGGLIQKFLKEGLPVPTAQTVTNRQVAELYAANFRGITLKRKHCKIGEIELSYEMNPEIFYQTIDRHTENY